MRRLVFSRRFIQCLLIAGVLIFGISGWMVDNYRWLRTQTRNDQKLRVEAVEEVVLLRTELQDQRVKLSGLQERIESSQKLLTDWKGLAGLGSVRGSSVSTAESLPTVFLSPPRWLT